MADHRGGGVLGVEEHAPMPDLAGLPGVASLAPPQETEVDVKTLLP